VFGYCEELLCFVVIAEEIDARARGWSIGALGSMGATGAGLSSLVFALVNVLPFGWRALYIIGGGALLVLAYFRRWLPETRRFELRRQEIAVLGSKASVAWTSLRRLVGDYPGRLAALLASVGFVCFSVAPAVILMSKYLQQTHHYRPGQITILYVGGGLFSVAGNIFAGRISDRLGRRVVLFAAVVICALSFGIVFSGIGGPLVPLAWITAIFGYLSSDALLAGYPAEIFPTAYRATASTLRYVVSTLGGAASLALEGIFYDWFGGHGPAVLLALAAAPIALCAILFLPEPAGRSLEDISEPEKLTA
jgi:putative MFS transporter